MLVQYLLRLGIITYFLYTIIIFCKHYAGSNKKSYPKNEFILNTCQFEYKMFTKSIKTIKYYHYFLKISLKCLILN